MKKINYLKWSCKFDLTNNAANIFFKTPFFSQWKCNKINSKFVLVWSSHSHALSDDAGQQPTGEAARGNSPHLVASNNCRKERADYCQDL